MRDLFNPSPDAPDPTGHQPLGSVNGRRSPPVYYEDPQGWSEKKASEWPLWKISIFRRLKNSFSRSTRHAAGRLLWLAATAVGHQEVLRVRRHPPRDALATPHPGKKEERSRAAAARLAAPRRAAPRLALQQRHAHTHPRARARSARAKRPSSRESNLEPKAPGSNRGPAQPPLLRFLQRQSGQRLI